MIESSFREYWILYPASSGIMKHMIGGEKLEGGMMAEARLGALKLVL